MLALITTTAGAFSTSPAAMLRPCSSGTPIVSIYCGVTVRYPAAT